MCGLAGIYSHKPVATELYDSLIHLQHRGQDAAGITTYNKMKILTRGNYLDQEKIHKLISDLNITTDDKNILLKLTPADYTGLANKLAQLK